MPQNNYLSVYRLKLAFFIGKNRGDESNRQLRSSPVNDRNRRPKIAIRGRLPTEQLRIRVRRISLYPDSRSYDRGVSH
jgi:hypothetical protein